MPAGEPPKTLSPSGADTWVQCPRKWWAKYILRIEDPAGPEAIIGTMAHEVLEHLGRIEPGGRTADRARTIAVELWAEHGSELRRPAWGHVIRALRIDDIANGTVVEVERKLAATIGGVPFYGLLDRADRLSDDKIVVLDYKTGSRPDRDAWLSSKRLQVTIYAAAYEQLTERTVDQIELVWTATGTVDRWQVRDQDLEHAVAYLQRVWGEIQDALATGVFDAKPGPLCSWCPAVGDCDAGKEAVLARAGQKGKKLGAHGQDVIYQQVVAGMEATLAVQNREHLTVVPDPPDDVAVEAPERRERVRRYRPVRMP